jgi:hypothetical protein
MKKILSIIILLNLFWNGIAQQHEHENSDSTVTLKEVLINHNMGGSYISKATPLKTEVITNAGLMQLACCNLGESFENSATVDAGYSDAVSGAKQIQMLGLTGLYSQMMYENMPMLKGISASYGLAFIPGPFLESIQISKGTSSVINGYEALSGQINLEYRKPQSADPLFVNIYLNHELQTDANIIGTIKINEKLSTSLFGHASFFGRQLDHIGDDGFMDKPKNLMVNLLNRWYYGGEKYHNISTVNAIYNRRIGGQMDFNPKKIDTLWGFESSIKRLQAFTKNAFLLADDGANIGTQLSATYTDLFAKYGYKSYKAKEFNVYVNLIFEKTFADIHKLNTGISYQFNFLDDTYISSPPLLSPSQFKGNKAEHIPGVFAQYSLTLDKISVVSGVRYDYNSFYNKHLFTPRIHLKWGITDNIALRASIGKGYRSPNIFAENIALMASSRIVEKESDITMEDAWNYGFNYVHTIYFNNSHKVTLSFDAYRTEFVNQLVINQDRDAHYLYFYMSREKSYSNALQAEAKFSLFDEHWDLTLAGRFNDVRQTLDGQLLVKPLSPRWKALVVNNIRIDMDKWQFDITAQFNGPARLPNTGGAMDEYGKPYVIMHAQITKRFKYVDLYAGCENIFNQVQKEPIIDAAHPFSSNFDATVIWGSLMGRTFYIGVRLTL